MRGYAGPGLPKWRGSLQVGAQGSGQGEAWDYGEAVARGLGSRQLGHKPVALQHSDEGGEGVVSSSLQAL